jgi:peptidoglycan hydrolase CwlO-like protein
MQLLLKLSLLLFIPFLFANLLCANEINLTQVIDQRAKLESELAELEKLIEKDEQLIRGLQMKSTTLERDLAILDAQVRKARLGIRARNLAISKLSSGIEDRSGLIDELEQKIEAEKISLSELLRKINELDATSLVEIILGHDTLSEFFEDFSSFESIQREMQVSLVDIKNTQIKTVEEKRTLEAKKSEELELRYIQELEKKRMEENEGEKKYLLRISKGKEERYQKILAARQKTAAEIRSELFLLRGSPAIPFEKAVEYTNIAWRATGVRPAFLLGVIAEESNLGANVGTGNWKKDLSHSRCKKQRVAFLKITSELGLDPDVLPVSRRAWYGYCGGAMGPAQFMPTTWQLYNNKITRLTGHNPPSP